MKRSLIFWMWNDILDADVIRQQIRDFARKNIGGFFVHAMPSEFRKDDFPGGMPGYLSENFFEMIKVAVECAAEYGMQEWLYDEGGWPSGTLNGRMAKEHPELLIHHILPTGEIVPVEGRPDLLNPQVTEIFIRETHEQYARHLRPYFGTVVPGIFTDEPFFGKFIRGKMLPWSPVLAERFREQKNYDARDAAMRIFHDNDPVAARDYCQVWVSLMRDSFLLPVRNWCHRNDLLSIGHFNGDDSLKNARELLGSDLFALHDGFDICGCDTIWRQIHPLQKETDFSRLTSSASGSKMSISESFAVYGYDLSLAEMKQVAAMQFVSGITIVAPMAAHYSNCGGRQVTTVSNWFGEADMRWHNYGKFSDFLIRMSHVFDRTSPVIKASFPYPLAEMQRGEFTGEIFADALKLAGQQITYDYRPDAPELPEKITPDLEMCAPVPQLRTRHLRSPRGNRWILVNAGLETVHCRFAAPEGFNVWYDPASGKRSAAKADASGNLILELPFAGAMVLLNIPGRAQTAAPAAAEKAPLPLTFAPTRVIRMSKGSPSGLVKVPVPENIPEKFSGTLRYEADVTIDRDFAGKLELPQAKRCMAELYVDGETYGTQLWQPYRWQLQLPPGKHHLMLDISGTPAAAMNDPEHIQWLKANGMFNSYMDTCALFEPLFPDEKPVAEAYLQ